MKHVCSWAFAAGVYLIGLSAALSLLGHLWPGWLFLAGGLFTSIVYDPITRWADARLFHVEQKMENIDAV